MRRSEKTSDDVLRGMAEALGSNPAQLCVDLDGTLITTDLLFESLARLLKYKPWLLFLIPLWLMRGRAALKRNLAQRVSIDASLLPYNARFLDWLRAEKALGREIVLATAADEIPARAVAAHLGLFSRVLASDGQINLKGGRKLDALRREIGGSFEYAGNSEADLEIWRGCSGAILVNASPSLTKRVEGRFRVVKTFQKEGGVLRSYFRALRVHQWAKNSLIFVPLITSHQLLHGALVVRATIIAALLSLCSSAQYVLNDLIDLDADRGHPIKKQRPFAAGGLPIVSGMVLSAALLTTSLVTAWFISHLLAGLLGTYFIVSLSYSLYLKRILLVDVFVLSGLYTFRIIAGHIVIGAEFSVWLVSFSLFLFLSLAFCKRMAELRILARSGTEMAGRGYEGADASQVNIFGVCSAFLAAVVFILYLQSDKVRELYRRPQILWLLAPVFLYWITRTWMLTHRGKVVIDDPVLFVLKDPVTYIVGLISGLIMLAATRDWFLPLVW